MEKNKELKLLKTAKGQIDGIIKMYEDNRGCFDISNQILATVAILKKVNISILINQLSKCVFDQNTPDSKKVDEVVGIIKKLSK